MTSARNEPKDSPLKILVCCHKSCELPPLDDGILLPIHAGKESSNADLHMQGDNEVNGQPCDNISSKNNNWCELTVIYWAWKNIRKVYPNVKYVGVSHYRRYFSFSDQKTRRRDPEEIKNYRVDLRKAIDILESGKIIVPTKNPGSLPLAIGYCMGHLCTDYYAFRDVVKNDYPDYFPAFEKIFERGNEFYAMNMFVMKYDDFVKYCEWLFGILFKTAEKVDPHNDEYHRRAFGYISERLFNVWLVKNRKKTHSLRVCSYREPENPTAFRRNIFTRAAGFFVKGFSYVLDKVILKMIVMRYKYIEKLRARF